MCVYYIIILPIVFIRIYDDYKFGINSPNNDEMYIFCDILISLSRIRHNDDIKVNATCIMEELAT